MKADISQIVLFDSLLYALDEKHIFKSEWIQTVKTTLNCCGFSRF